mgnify:CR=1
VYEYYSSIASRSGADSRVMGIATAFRTTPYLGWFFCLHQAIYTDPFLVI